MKICKKHWDQCLNAIDVRGLTHLISADLTALEGMVARDGIEMSSDTYDPIVAMMFMIWGRGIEAFGINAMLVDTTLLGDESRNHGHICPLCAARMAFDHHNTQTGRCGDPQCIIQLAPGETPWDDNIVGAASDAILRFCREQSLVPPLQ